MASGNIPNLSVSLSLPWAVVNALDDRAHAERTSRSALAARYLTAALKLPSVDDPVPSTSPPVTPTTKKVDKAKEVCQHPKAVTISGGLKRCDDCGSVRTADNVWKATP